MTLWRRALLLASGLLLLALPAKQAGAASSAEILQQWATWPYPAQCGVETISPVAVFSSPAGAENGSLPSEVGLREALADPETSWVYLAQTGYRLLAEDAESASFVSGGARRRNVLPPAAKGRRALEARRLGALFPEHLDPGSRGHQLESRPRSAASAGGDAANPDRTRGKLLQRREKPQRAGAKARLPSAGEEVADDDDPEPTSPGCLHLSGGATPAADGRGFPSRLGKRILYDGGSFPPRTAAETRPRLY